MAKNEIDRFYDFLLKHKVCRGSTNTHTSMGKPYGCFNITGRSKRERFTKLYTKAIKEDADHLITG